MPLTDDTNIITLHSIQMPLADDTSKITQWIIIPTTDDEKSKITVDYKLTQKSIIKPTTFGYTAVDPNVFERRRHTNIGGQSFVDVIDF